MAKKIFNYRGKTLDELKVMSLNQLAELFTSRVRRKIKRGFSESKKKFIKKTELKNVVKTHSRDVPILPKMVGKTIKVYNGKEFIDVIILPEMVGHVLGEFTFTRKQAGHSKAGIGDKKKKR